MAIARAVVEYVASGKLGARTLFATHYHELTELEDKLERVKNYNIAAKKRGDDIIFLRKIVRGGADDSYGIEVAKLAGLPDCVVERSKEILASLESGKEVRSSGRKSSRSRVDPGQITLVDQGAAKIAQRLGSLDINTLTPLEALNILYEMKRGYEEEQTPIAAVPAKGIFKGIFLLVMYLAVFPVLTGLLVAGASAWMNWEISEKAQLLIPYYASFLLTIVLFKDFLIDNLRVFFFRFGRSLGSMFLSYLLSYVMTIVVVAVLPPQPARPDNPNDIAMGLLVEMYDKPMVV